GGLELLLENSTKVHKVEVTTPKDGQGKVTMKFLLSWVKENLIKERPEMFLKADSVQRTRSCGTWGRHLQKGSPKHV
ncbi:hypothetical protein ACJX0J_032004, partial [Zea mays]